MISGGRSSYTDPDSEELLESSHEYAWSLTLFHMEFRDRFPRDSFCRSIFE